MRQSISEKSYTVMNYVFIIIGSLLVFYPFYYCVMLSFNSGLDAQKGGIYFWPRVFTLENYQFVFSTDAILIAARNSILRTVAGTILALLVTSMFGYVVSKKDLLFRKTYMTIGLITMYFGGGLIPYFLLIKSLGLYNNFMVYIYPNLFSMFNALIFLSFFRSIPDSLDESARIDGANDFTIYWKCYVPLSKPVFATIALFVGVGHWNSWFDTMLFAAQKPQLETLSHILTKMINAQRFIDELTSKRNLGVGVAISGMTATALMLATMVVTAFPIIVLYPFLQRYFVKGVMIGSLKG